MSRLPEALRFLRSGVGWTKLLLLLRGFWCMYTVRPVSRSQKGLMVMPRCEACNSFKIACSQKLKEM